MLRRLVLATLVIYGSEIFFYQILLLMVLNLFVIMITIVTDSLESKSMLWLQTVGEVSTLAMIDFFLIFRVVSVEENFVLGYATIISIGVYILICFVFILCTTVVESKTRLIHFLAKKKYQKQREDF